MVAASETGGRPRLQHLRVLIVEDSWVVAQSLKEMVAAEGASVLGPVPSVEGALDYVGAEPIDVALVDMMLRDSFADRLVDKLVANGIPYLIITGYEALPTDADRHAIGTLHKPVDANRLVEMLSEIVPIV